MLISIRFSQVLAMDLEDRLKKLQPCLPIALSISVTPRRVIWRSRRGAMRLRAAIALAEMNGGSGGAQNASRQMVALDEMESNRPDRRLEVGSRARRTAATATLKRLDALRKGG